MMITTAVPMPDVSKSNHVAKRNQAISSLTEHDPASGLPELDDEFHLWLIDLDLASF